MHTQQDILPYSLITPSNLAGVVKHKESFPNNLSGLKLKLKVLLATTITVIAVKLSSIQQNHTDSQLLDRLTIFTGAS